jgi:hypothetical protein
MRVTGLRIAVLNRELNLSQVIVEAHWFVLRKAVAAQNQINAVPAIQNVKTPSYSVFRSHFCSAREPAEFASVCNPAEDRIVSNDYRCTSYSTRKAKIDFATVLPSAPRLLFAEPV